LGNVTAGAAVERAVAAVFRLTVAERVVGAEKVVAAPALMAEAPELK
jgi:hypothetical protein